MREKLVVFFISLVLPFLYVFTPKFWPVLSTQVFGSGDVVSFLWLFHGITENVLTGAPLFDGKIYFPNPESFVFSEPAFFSGAVYRFFYSFFKNPMLSINLTTSLFLSLNFFCMYVFCRNFAGKLASAVGAGLFAFSIVRITRLNQIHLMCQFFMPLTAHLLWRFENDGRLKTLLLAAVCFSIQFYFSLSLGMITMIGFFLYLPLKIWFTKKDFPWRAYLPALVVAALILAPLALTFFGIRSQYQTVRSLDEARWNSAYITHYLLVPENHFYAPILANRNLFQRALSLTHEKILFVGFVCLGFMIYGMRELAKNRTPLNRFWKVWVFSSLVFVMWMSFGPQSKLYTFFYYVLPGMKGIRTPARFGLNYLFLASLLVTFGVAKFQTLKKTWKHSALLGLLLVWATWENFFPQWFAVPDAQSVQTNAWLKARPDKFAVVHLPYTYMEEERTYGTIHHGHPIANGYSGFLPPTFAPIRELAESTPTQESVQKLNDWGFGYVVLATEKLPAERVAEWKHYATTAHLEVTATDRGTTIIALPSPKPR